MVIAETILCCSKFMWFEIFMIHAVFALKVNFCDKIFVNILKFCELLVTSTLTSLSTSHAFHG